MKRTMKEIIVTGIVGIFIMLLAVVSVGCQAVQDDDGTTSYKFGLSPEMHDTMAKGGDQVTGTLSMLSAFLPALAPFATAAGTGTLVWRRMKKDVTKFQDPMTMYVKALEHLKQTDQATWNKVKAEIKGQYPSANIEGTVKELKAELHRLGQLPNGPATPEATPEAVV